MRDINHLLEHLKKAVETGEPFFPQEHDIEMLEEYTNISLPSADAEWIPCSERLPEEGEKVLASTTNTVFTQVFKGTHGTSDSWWWNNNTIKTIYAWMPLPKPYKGGDTE